MKRKLRLAILISGSGSTMEAIVKSCKNGKLKNKIEPVVVISNKENIPGIDKAKRLNVSVEIVKNNKYLLSILKKYKPDIISQNGWLPLTPANVIKEYKNKIFNQHPAPLDPDNKDRKGNSLHFGGKGMHGLAVHKAVLDFQRKAKRRFPTEATIHKVTEKFDEGEVVARLEVPVLSSDTPESLAKRVLPFEHKLFIEFLEKEYLGTNKVLKRKSSHKILILGSGGREDAIAWKLRQSPEVSDIFQSKKLTLDINSPSQVLKVCKELGITFVVVGSDEPAQHGVVDALTKSGIPAFGPTKKAAIIERSKVFSTKFMKKYKIPQPATETFSSYTLASKFLESNRSWFNQGIVVKADGLALGKGAIVCGSVQDAKKALKEIMVNKKFGNAGKKVVIQQKLNGFEVSVTVISDGKKYLVLPYTEDHKQAYDDDLGPNTGGMGVVAPHPLINSKLSDKIEKLIIKPTIDNLLKGGREFRGTLYPGLMIVDGEPYVLEFNARFGDPEIEALLPLLPSNIDFFKLLFSASKGNIYKSGYLKTKKASVVVTLASSGYPIAYKKGIPIKGLNKKFPSSVIVFHAGCKKTDSGYETSGGRVLMITALANTLASARGKAYKVIGKHGIYFKGMHYRQDIGSRKR